MPADDEPPIVPCGSTVYRDGDMIVLEVVEGDQIRGRLRFDFDGAILHRDQVAAVIDAIEAERNTELSPIGADLLAEAIRNTEALEIARAASE
jgi:hypothetical protein